MINHIYLKILIKDQIIFLNEVKEKVKFYECVQIITIIYSNHIYNGSNIFKNEHNQIILNIYIRIHYNNNKKILFIFVNIVKNKF